MKHVRLYAMVITLLLGVGAAVLPTVTAAADGKSIVCTTLGSDAGCTGTPPNGVDLNHVITAVINILSIVIGIVAVIMIMVGGFKYITSNGDSNSISSAKSTIIYAIIGLIIVALAQVIVQFVLSKVT